MDAGLDGLAVLITGASGGIGEALALAFASEGARLVLHGHSNPAKLDALVERCGGPERAIAGTADLREPEALDALLERARASFGGVDVAVVNAGIWPSADLPLHELPISRIRDVIEVNLLGAIYTCRSFASGLARRGPRADGRGASVCLIGSTAGRFGEAGHLEYAVSKSGLVGLMRSFKNEIVRLDPWARVNLVEPGWTVTPMAEAALEVEGSIEKVCATMPLRQLARPEDVARAVVFLSSPVLARHLSGEILTVAGGMEGRQLWSADAIDPAAVRARLQRDESV